MNWDVCNDDGVECPYCSYVYDDTDLPHDSGNWECPDCERTFGVEVEYSATYYSTKPESEVDSISKQMLYWEKPEDKNLKYASQILLTLAVDKQRYEKVIAKNNLIPEDKLNGTD